ncbi:hypothetical protein B9Z55_018592 [Caenorhabditis nigoni]|uniref:Homeobox domain-containing protein n=1 Tax=Caenorhabditis nigoni TaxID=1611254 RepID=A0A2G5TF36_9PELO|nr:hypothetical protein B9Z55_018592 [Caenorhabditis nigoni]
MFFVKLNLSRNSQKFPDKIIKMESTESEEGPSSSGTPSREIDTQRTPSQESRPPTIPQPRLEIWNRIKYGHVSTAMKIRSLLLFISSSLITFIETISEPKRDKVPPTEIITRIATSFINGSVDQKQRLSHETFLDILLEKIPDADVRGMHYHEVYLAISPMISSVNWARIKFDRRDAMRCYRSLSSILQVCFEQIGLANHGEADQLMLAIYVTSVWCSILKQHPELSQPISDYQDFESYMKNWIFHSHFENFSKVFVASCCQIMESSDQMQDQMQQNQTKMANRNPPRNHELSRSLSMPAAVPETVHNAVPSPSHVHPSWMNAPPQPFMGYMSPGIVFSQFPLPNPPIDPHQNHPMILVQPPTKQKPSRAAKRKQKVPEASKPTDPTTKGPSKKGPRPGTKYRQRITTEASMILEFEANRLATSPPDRHSKRKISERTNISLYQVKSFFNRITAEQRRLKMGKPIRRYKRSTKK